MKLFDLLFQRKNSEEKQLELRLDRSHLIDRSKVDSDAIDRMQRVPASEAYCNYIYKKYYSDYPEKPFISKDREIYSNWLIETEQFPEPRLLPIEMMTRYDDGLLPGHVYMLFWIDSIQGKGRKIPVYFEYAYGIEFVKEREFLLKEGYLEDENHLSEKGRNAIERHKDVINERHPAPVVVNHEVGSDVSEIFSGRILPDKMEDGVFKIPEEEHVWLDAEIALLNQFTKEALKLAKVNTKLEIRHLLFDPEFEDTILHLPQYTYYEVKNTTPTGRLKKVPLTIHYAAEDHEKMVHSYEVFKNGRDYRGEIRINREGRIDSADLIFWVRKNGKGTGYQIKIGRVDSMLVVKKVDISYYQSKNWACQYKLDLTGKK